MEKLLLVVYLLGCFFCLVNIYTSWCRYPVHKYLLKKPDSDFKFVSGIPLLGSLFIVLSLYFISDNLILLCLGIFLSVLDTGGIHWYIATLIYASRKDNSI